MVEQHPVTSPIAPSPIVINSYGPDANHVENRVEPSPPFRFPLVDESLRAVLRIEPKTLVRFPDYPSRDDLIQFDVILSLPDFTACSADETSIEAFQALQSNCRDLCDRTSDTIGFSGVAGAFFIDILRQADHFLVRGHICMPFANWEERAADIVNERCWRFPATMTFAFVCDKKAIASACDEIDKVISQVT